MSKNRHYNRRRHNKALAPNNLPEGSNVLDSKEAKKFHYERNKTATKLDNQLEAVRELADEVNEVTLDLQRQVNSLRKELIRVENAALVAKNEAQAANSKLKNRLTKLKVLTIGTTVLVVLHLIYVVHAHL